MYSASTRRSSRRSSTGSACARASNSHPPRSSSARWPARCRSSSIARRKRCLMLPSLRATSTRGYMPQQLSNLSSAPAPSTRATSSFASTTSLTARRARGSRDERHLGGVACRATRRDRQRACGAFCGDRRRRRDRARPSVHSKSQCRVLITAEHEAAW